MPTLINRAASGSEPDANQNFTQDDNPSAAFSRILLQRMKSDEDSNPMDLSMNEVHDNAGFYYGITACLSSRQFNPSARLRSDAAATTETSGERRPRFRYWLAKGCKGFNKIINYYKSLNEVTATADIDEILFGFYANCFHQNEYVEIEKLKNKEDIWHLAFVGYKNLKVPDNSESHWTVLAACSFTPLQDQKHIYLQWIAVDKNVAEWNDWNNISQHTNKDSDLSKFFDGSHFRYGKGIGMNIVGIIQYICIELALPVLPPNVKQAPTPNTTTLHSSKDISFYTSIICQSSYEALSFYKAGCGMVEINSTKVPLEVIASNTYIQSYQLIPVELYGYLWERRSPEIKTKLCSIPSFIKKSVYDCYFALQSRPQIPSHLKQSSSESDLYQLNENDLKKLHNQGDSVKLDLNDGIHYKTGGLCSSINSEKLIVKTLSIDESKFSLLQVPQEIVSFVILRILVLEFLDGSHDLTKIQKSISLRNGQTVQEEANDNLTDEQKRDYAYQRIYNSLFSIRDRSATFDEERQFLIQYLWHCGKSDLKIPQATYTNTHYISIVDPKLDQVNKAGKNRKPWVKIADSSNVTIPPDCPFKNAFLKNVYFLQNLQQTFNKSDLSYQFVQEHLHRLAMFLANDRIISNNSLILLLLSSIFNAGLYVVKFKKLKEKFCWEHVLSWYEMPRSSSIKKRILIIAAPPSDTLKGCRAKDMEWNIALSKSMTSPQYKKLQDLIINYKSDKSAKEFALQNESLLGSPRKSPQEVINQDDLNQNLTESTDNLESPTATQKKKRSHSSPLE
jgi:hypothetical protein